LRTARICVVGQATAERLAGYGVKADLIPAEFRAEAVAPAIAEERPLAGLKVLLPRADIGREVIAEDLRKHNADVTEVIAYRTLAADATRDRGPDVYRMLLERQLDVVTFASPSAVRNFVRLLGDEPAADLLQTTVVACLGPVTAEAASQCNIHTAVMPTSYTIPALVKAIVEYFHHVPNS